MEPRRTPAKILVAVDGSPDAALAARAASDISRRFGSELHVVHGWHAIPTARLRAFARREFRNIGKECLERGVGEVREAGADVTEAHLVEGRAADVILDLAGDLRADLVLMGSRGLGPVRRLALGSVSESVVHHARFPVVVLRGGDESWPPARIVFGDDGSEAAAAAGDLAANLCAGRGSQGILVRAFPRLPSVDTEAREFDPRVVEDELRHEENALTRRARELEGILGSHPKVRVAVGDASAILLEAADEETNTLVAVGSRGLSAGGRLRLGGVSTKVLRAAAGPVLVHPPR